MKEKMHYKPIATKINNQTYEELKRICDKSGIKVYAIIQIVIDGFIKLLSKEHIITNEMKIVVSNFLPLMTNKMPFTLNEPNYNKFKCSKCIAIIEKEKYENSQALLLKQDSKTNEILANRNSDTILKTLLNTLDISLIPELNKIKEREHFCSLNEALRFSIMSISNNTCLTIDEEIRQMFCDNSRGEFGKEIDYANLGKYKRVMHKQVN